MKIFGTDGIRGVIGKDLTPEFCYNIGKAVAIYLKQNCVHKPKIIVGKDTRLSGDMVLTAFSSGVLSHGVDIAYVGITPTASVAFLAKKFDLGVMLTASHNPAEFNGIKIFLNNGRKLDEENKKNIYFIIKNLCDYKMEHNINFGKLEYEEELLYDYVAYLLKHVEKVKPQKVLLDCANGATYKVAPYVFKRLNFDVDTINAINDGEHINDNCGVLHIGNLIEKMASGKYDIGFAFDGDGDRVHAVLKDGTILDGDKLLFVLAKLLRIDGAVVGTVMTNFGVEMSLQKNKIKLIRTRVGDKHIADKIVENNLLLGGERAGHIILSDYLMTGDGIFVALKLCELAQGVNILNLLQDLQEYPSIESTFEVEEKSKTQILKSKKIIRALQEFDAELNGVGRIVLRASGTEAILRLLVEGEDKALIEIISNKLSSIITTVIDEVQSNY